MFKFIYRKLKEMFTLPLRPPENCEQSLATPASWNPEIVFPARNRQENINELRNRIIRDELISETAGIEASTLNIVESSDEITYEQQVQSLTGNGLEVNTREVLIRTAEGHLVKAAELHHGGRCGICRKLTDREHFRHCVVCQIPLCASCAEDFRELTLCPEHYRQALFYRDTWDED